MLFAFYKSSDIECNTSGSNYPKRSLGAITLKGVCLCAKRCTEFCIIVFRDIEDGLRATHLCLT